MCTPCQGIVGAGTVKCEGKSVILRSSKPTTGVNGTVTIYVSDTSYSFLKLIESSFLSD
jgi:hypothetical protein